MLTKMYVKTALWLDSLKKDQRGVTSIEYAVIAAAIATIGRHHSIPPTSTTESGSFAQ